jgi:sugar phosphate isomerase/epimerase
VARVAAAVRRAGLDCVELVPGFPDLRFGNPGDVTAERCRLVAAAFQDAGVGIACVDAVTDLLDPNLTERHRAVLRCHAIIRHCRSFDTDKVCVAAGPGTGGMTVEQPLDESTIRQGLRLMLHEIVDRAEDAGVTVLLKPRLGGPFAALENVCSFRAEFADRAVRLMLDPATALAKYGTAGVDGNLDHLCKELLPWSAALVAKGLCFEENGPVMPRVGRGVLDYERVLGWLRQAGCNVPVILEHVRVDELASARAYVLQCWLAANNGAPARARAPAIGFAESSVR